MKNPLFRHLSSKLNAAENCRKSGNGPWQIRHESSIWQLVKDFMPSGSGIDTGTKLADESTSEKLVFTFGYHHMNEGGMYDGWTEHKAIVTPSLQFGYTLKITGRDRNQIKEYLHEVFDSALTLQLEETVDGYSEVTEK